jgi:hypothetical protein
LGSGGTTSKKFFPENIFLNLILCFRSIFPYFFGKMSLKYFTSYPNPCFADHPLTGGGGGGVIPPPPLAPALYSLAKRMFYREA